MFKLVILPCMLGFVLFLTAHILINADEIARHRCLENAICYKADVLK